MRLTEEKYGDHHRNNDGYCQNCDEITRFGGVEPDAEELECPECDQDSVFGVEQSMIAGLIEVVGDDEDDEEEVIESEDEDDD